MNCSGSKQTPGEFEGRNSGCKQLKLKYAFETGHVPDIHFFIFEFCTKHFLPNKCTQVSALAKANNSTAQA